MCSVLELQQCVLTVTLIRIVAHVCAAVQAQLSSAPVDAGLNVWDMANLGYQATSHILGLSGTNASSELSSSHDPLTRFVSLTGDFPTLSKWLTTLKFPQGVKEDADKNKQ